MTKEDAVRLVNNYLTRLANGRSYEFAILDRSTREEDFGWVFFYNSKQFVETGDRRWALGGNAPLIVDRHSGELHVTGTAHSIEYYIEEFRRARPQGQ